VVYGGFVPLKYGNFFVTYYMLMQCQNIMIDDFFAHIARSAVSADSAKIANVRFLTVGTISAR
jgi:hypothetical protein